MKRTVIFQLLLDRFQTCVRIAPSESQPSAQLLPKAVMADIFRTLRHSPSAPSVPSVNQAQALVRNRSPNRTRRVSSHSSPPTDNLICAQVWISCQGKRQVTQCCAKLSEMHENYNLEVCVTVEPSLLILFTHIRITLFQNRNLSVCFLSARLCVCMRVHSYMCACFHHCVSLWMSF